MDRLFYEIAKNTKSIFRRISLCLIFSGYLPRGFCDQSKILSTSKFLFAWLMLLVFSSSLIYRMTNRTMTPPFVDFDTLLRQSKYNVVIFEGSITYELVKVLGQISNSYSALYKSNFFISLCCLLNIFICVFQKYEFLQFVPYTVI